MKRNGYKLKDENLSQKMILNYESGVIPKRVMGMKVTGTFSVILEKSCDRAEVPFSSLVWCPVTSVCLQSLQFVRNHTSDTI